MADEQDLTLGLGCGGKLEALDRVRCHWFLEHDVIAGRQRRHGWLEMRTILGADQQAVCETRLGQEVAPVGEGEGWRDAVRGTAALPTLGVRLGDGNHGRLARVVQHIPAITVGAALAGTHERKRDSFHATQDTGGRCQPDRQSVSPLPSSPSGSA